MSFRKFHGPWLVLGLGLWIGAATASAQDQNPASEPPANPPSASEAQLSPPSDVWVASISAGIALTAGNSNTSTVNLAFDAVRDDHQRFVFTTSGLVIRGDTEDELGVDRRWLNTRLDARLSERTSAFFEGSYMRDRFKGINYMIAPTAGIALRANRTSRRDFVVDVSLGAVMEKNVNRPVETSPAFAAGERLALDLNSSARITQSFRTFLKLDDLGDVLYTFNLGLAASVSEHSELKAELVDTFKNEPPEAALARNDASILVSIVYKF